MSNVLAIIPLLSTSFKFLSFAPIININSILLCFIEKHLFDSMLVKMIKHARPSSLIRLSQLNV